MNLIRSLTPLQRAMLEKIARSTGTCENDAPSTYSDIHFADARQVVIGSADEATFASLRTARLVAESPSTLGSLVTLTEIGFIAYKAIKYYAPANTYKWTIEIAERVTGTVVQYVEYCGTDPVLYAAAEYRVERPAPAAGAQRYFPSEIYRITVTLDVP